ncbi:hypothetical protein [Vibrio phage VP41s3]|nr:hypothetical protein [Vibrio phage VP41s3]
MPRQQANLEFNQFKSGLITEGNILNLPVDAFREGENFVLTPNNSWVRRKGLDKEHEGIMADSYTDLDNVDTAFSVHTWYTHYSTLPEIVVVQIGDKLHFYDSQVEPLSKGKLTVNSQDYLSTNGTTDDLISAASVEGMFLFAIRGANPMSYQITDVSFGSNGDSTSANIQVTDTELILETRDLWGKKEPIKERRDEIDTDSQYELENQGWDFSKLQQCKKAIGKYPSDYDIWWMYKVSSSKDADEIGKFSAERMKDNEATGVGQQRQNTPAPRGSTIVSLSRLASGRPQTLQSYAGRVFFAGFESTPRLINDVRPDFGNHVFFSQVVKANADITKCYQWADPTSEVDSDVVDTDGGFIKINSARNIIGLEEVSTGLFVIAENGVWLISGTTSGLFSATGYQVNKVSDFGCVSPNSITSYNNNVFYFADEGIIGLIFDKTAGTHIAQNITETKIQSLYNKLPLNCKQRAVVTAQRSERYIRWLVSEGYSNPNSFSLEIIFSLNTGAFFINRFKSDIDTPETVLGYIEERNTSDEVGSGDYQVVVGLDKVIAGSSQVTVRLLRRSGGTSYKEIKYLVGNPLDDTIGFYQYNNEDFLDFGKVDAEAFLLSAPQKLDDTQRRKQIASLATHMARTDYTKLTGSNLEIINPSALSLRIRWDYADSVDSGKWSKERECYRYRRPLNLKQGDNIYPHEVITARERVRGSGTAFQFEFRTKPKHDAQLLGWAVSVTGGTQV